MVGASFSDGLKSCFTTDRVTNVNSHVPRQILFSFEEGRAEVGRAIGVFGMVFNGFSARIVRGDPIRGVLWAASCEFVGGGSNVLTHGNDHD